MNQIRFSRRRFLKAGFGSLLALGIPAGASWPGEKAKEKTGVFLGPGELGSLRAKLELPAMAHVRERLEQLDVNAGRRFLRSEARFERRIWDIPKICGYLRRSALAAAVWERREALTLTEEALQTLLRFREWDYLREGGEETIGLQRAPESVLSVVFALELVGSELPADLRAETERQLAWKGCLPCYRTLYGMDHPDLVRGWGFAPDAEVNFTELDFSRWPVILRSTNLHAVPLSALGIGSLYLLGKDERARLWLDLARGHVRDFCARTIGEDGAYVENVSYWGYAIEYLTLFLRGLERVLDEDLFDVANFAGQIEFAVAMQAGRWRVSGDVPDLVIAHQGLQPDIVNFSDSWRSFRQTGPAVIAAKLRDPLAQKAALERAGIWDEFVPVAYDPSVPVAENWPSHLLRKRFSNDWVVWRTGWGDDDVVIGFRSGGPANHEHADRNSVVLKAFGEWLLRDPRRAAYNRFDERWLLRLTAAHNAVLIDGEGHEYVDGREGTNSSRARAKIRRYVDRGGYVWLSSDATPAYRLVKPEVKLVVRTLLWVPPDVVIVLDKVEARKAVRVSARFFPDNEDGRAELEVKGSEFGLKRPGARALAAVACSVGASVHEDALSLKGVQHPYRFVEVVAEKASKVLLLAAFRIGRGDEDLTAPDVGLGAGEIQITWRGAAGRKHCRIIDSGDLPEVAIT